MPVAAVARAGAGRGTAAAGRRRCCRVAAEAVNVAATAAPPRRVAGAQRPRRRRVRRSPRLSPRAVAAVRPAARCCGRHSPPGAAADRPGRIARVSGWPAFGGSALGMARSAAAAAATADAGQRIAMGEQQRRRRLAHERRSASPIRPPRGTPAPAFRRGARRRRAAHGDRAHHRAGPAAPRRTGEDARAPGLRRVRVRAAVPRGDRQAGRCHHPAAARAAPAGKADRRAVHRAEIR